jgi:hypothetical protein
VCPLRPLTLDAGVACDPVPGRSHGIEVGAVHPAIAQSLEQVDMRTCWPSISRGDQVADNLGISLHQR